MAGAHLVFVERTARTIARWFFLFVFVGLAAAFSVAGCLPGDGILAITAFACVAVGATIGFLFSIPKSAQNSDNYQRASAGSAAPDNNAPKSNTNLEQISDWLVKILIGAGLVQLAKVRSLLEDMAEKLSRCVLTTKYADAHNGMLPPSGITDPFCHPFCLFLILYFLTLGLLTSYLITRLWLPLMIFKTEQGLKSGSQARSYLLVSRQKVNETVEAATQNQLMLQDALKTLEIALDGHDKGVASETNDRLAMQRSKECQKLFPVHRTLGIYMGRLAVAMGSLDQAIDILQQFIAAWETSGEKLDRDYAALLYNLACYKNLRAEALARENKNAEAEELRNRVWADLKRSILYDAENKTEAGTDSDLASLFNNTSRLKTAL